VARTLGRRAVKNLVGWAMNSDLTFYGDLFGDIKARIQTAQVRALLMVNGELLRLYWEIGQ